MVPDGTSSFLVLIFNLLKGDVFEKEKTSQIELLSNIDETLKEKKLLPKIKPKIDDVIELQAKQKKILLPKKKPEGQTKDQPELLTTQKESDEEKIIAKIDDKKLIFPKHAARYRKVFCKL